jgi:hypothetical protein
VTVNVSEAELLIRMHNSEDHFVERKTSSDVNDCLKTIVAFANSTPLGSYSVVFVGVENSGEIEPPKSDLEKLQKKLNKIIAGIYPQPSCIQQVVSERGRQAIAIVVDYSPKRPHFSGRAFVRRGSETFPATAEEIALMTQSRNPKVARILARKGEHVHVVNSLRTPQGPYETHWTGNPHIQDCNDEYITIGNGPNRSDWQTFSLSQIETGEDFKTNQFKITIHR